MDRDTFWKIIDDAHAAVGNAQGAPEQVTQHLATLELAEIVSFEQHRVDLEAESYRWDLWAVAYIINGGCSDDGFDYFRGWLLANGRKRWETALASPESIGEWVEADDEIEGEDMLYVADKAYEAKAGRELPYDTVTRSRPSDPAGEDWDEDQLEELYPALCAKFGGA